MRHITLIIFISLSIISMLTSQIPGESYIGRWDLTISKDAKDLPSWLEISKSGRGTLIGRFVYAMGSARPIAHVKVEGDQFSFSIPNQWEPTGLMSFKGHESEGSLKGTMTYVDGSVHSWEGIRAPTLERHDDPIWGNTQTLFNGSSMDGWHVDGTNQWNVVEGLLINTKSGGNLISDQVFDDFKLRVVFKYPEGSNSGIYLRGRYEVQQEYIITLIGRRVSVVANGKAIISDQIIPGITGGALDSREGEPGPIFIQGDHGAIEFKVIEITPALN